jgi:hypothetical protein
MALGSSGKRAARSASATAPGAQVKVGVFFSELGATLQDVISIPRAPGEFNLNSYVGRTIFEGPRVINFDTSLSRTFSVTERIKLTFRMDGFNSNNTPHYDCTKRYVWIVYFWNCSTAGRNYGNSHGDPRQFETALKLFLMARQLTQIESHLIQDHGRNTAVTWAMTTKET